MQRILILVNAIFRHLDTKIRVRNLKYYSHVILTIKYSRTHKIIILTYNVKENNKLP